MNNAINCRGSEILQRSKRQIDGVARLVFASALSFLSSKILPGEQSRQKIVDLVKSDSQSDAFYSRYSSSYSDSSRNHPDQRRYVANHMPRQPYGLSSVVHRYGTCTSEY